MEPGSLVMNYPKTKMQCVESINLELAPSTLITRIKKLLFYFSCPFFFTVFFLYTNICAMGFLLFLLYLISIAVTKKLKRKGKGKGKGHSR